MKNTEEIQEKLISLGNHFADLVLNSDQNQEKPLSTTLQIKTAEAAIKAYDAAMKNNTPKVVDLVKHCLSNILMPTLRVEVFERYVETCFMHSAAPLSRTEFYAKAEEYRFEHARKTDGRYLIPPKKS